MSKFIFIIIVGLFSNIAFAGVPAVDFEDPSTWTVTVTKIGEQWETPEIFSPEAYMNRDVCVNREVDAGLDINAIITLGEKIWKIVQDGAPVLEYESNSVSAIPNGAVCPFNMSGWSAPRSATYELKYVNAFGMDMINFKYKVIYSYGGKYLDRGAYLTNVSVHPADIHVAWGQNFNANVNVAQTLNVGTSEDPVAGMQVILEWNVGNPLNKFKSQRVYFVEGRGSLTEL